MVVVITLWQIACIAHVTERRESSGRGWKTKKPPWRVANNRRPFQGQCRPVKPVRQHPRPPGVTALGKALVWATKLKGLQSQCAQVLAWLRAGKPLTPKMAMDLFGCYRLAARIEDLRRAGHPISSKMITVTSRNGGLSRVAEYRMEVAA